MSACVCDRLEQSSSYCSMFHLPSHSALHVIFENDNPEVDGYIPIDSRSRYRRKLCHEKPPVDPHSTKGVAVFFFLFSFLSLQPPPTPRASTTLQLDDSLDSLTRDFALSVAPPIASIACMHVAYPAKQTCNSLHWWRSALHPAMPSYLCKLGTHDTNGGVIVGQSPGQCNRRPSRNGD